MAADSSDTHFITICDDGFVPGLAVLLWSLRRQVPGFDGMPFRVVHHPEIAPLDERSREILGEVFPNVVFEQVDLSRYPGLTREDGHSPDALYLSFEAFRPSSARRVVYIDADMLVLRDLSEVFAIDHDFIVCPTGGNPVSGDGPDHGPDEVNAGFFVLGPGHLDGSTLDRLFDRLRRNVRGEVQDRAIEVLRDQAIISAVLSKSDRHLMSDAWNFQAFHHLAYFSRRASEIRILHFSGYGVRPKPWEATAPVESLAYRIWIEAARAAVDELPTLEPLVPHIGTLCARLDTVRARTRTGLGILETLRADIESDLVSAEMRFGDTPINRLRQMTPAWVAKLARRVLPSRG